jgi:hypothetical protein
MYVEDIKRLAQPLCDASFTQPGHQNRTAWAAASALEEKHLLKRNRCCPHHPPAPSASRAAPSHCQLLPQSGARCRSRVCTEALLRHLSHLQPYQHRYLHASIPLRRADYRWPMPPHPAACPGRAATLGPSATA